MADKRHRYPHTAGFPFWLENTNRKYPPPPPDLPKIFLIFDTQILWGRTKALGLRTRALGENKGFGVGSGAGAAAVCL